jgi:excisionase family DNA binding protein
VALRETVLLTLTEAASRLRVSRSTVQRLIRAGALPVTQLGRRRLVRLEDLEALVASHVSRSGSATREGEGP